MTRSTPQIRRRLGALLTGGALAAGVAVAGVPAEATSRPLGERSLAAVLTSDGNQFDSNRGDYDIVTEAVLAVLADDPASDVGVLTDGSVQLTAFLPRDRAFRVLVRDLTGHWYASERRVFNELAEAVGIEAIETVLLYHVVPGARITSADALASDGATPTTAQGGTFTVDVVDPAEPKIRLRDADPDDYDPKLVPGQLDINRRNKQIAHGMTQVLRPLDL